MSWKCKPAQRGESDISASGFSLTIEELSQFDTVAGAFGWAAHRWRIGLRCILLAGEPV
jgi:hypothetical protein